MHLPSGQALNSSGPATGQLHLPGPITFAPHCTASPIPGPVADLGLDSEGACDLLQTRTAQSAFLASFPAARRRIRGFLWTNDEWHYWRMHLRVRAEV